ncbi:2,3-diaminopropionate biosynthesis protein SbnB [Kutzneria sp. CA-103260]|uniref:2,3-diaminopropionate biosynthesis protein SbnB n=1 Tax=Kutzneria sp. CA-103260 TaxID=2802641 RepID=UPI001BEED2C9|nr:2,3-diaminopropionate biosynthesis protein SbnB [Kutzneria sp. CA-103260]QUQ68744.1 2,3-diaminopropionate biosynthesis protein SbnB [Kutzneria sp. CA-103260]
MTRIHPAAMTCPVSAPASTPTFAVISGAQVQRVLTGCEDQVVEVIDDAYRLHCFGSSTENPRSCFLRLPDRPSCRITALPASIGGQVGVDGVKWISSFPGNVAAGLPRASAVLILNDHDTGYPFACMEGSIISATRTAALAALAAEWLSCARPRPARIGFFGTGLIARYIHTYLAATGWSFDETGVYDPASDSVAGFRGYLERSGAAGRITEHHSAERLIRTSDVVVFATVATRPHVGDLSWFEHNPLVLHMSQRDLTPEIVLASVNIVDDVEHCLTTNTSMALAERRAGNRDFLCGTLDDVMDGRVSLPVDRPLVFSPFGLGVLDVVLGKYVYDEVARSGELRVVDDFFHELSRYT